LRDRGVSNRSPWATLLGGAKLDMSGTSYFEVGILLGFVCFFLGVASLMVYIGGAVSPDSGFIVGVVFGFWSFYSFTILAEIRRFP
jgi:hypothetical protein